MPRSGKDGDGRLHLKLCKVLMKHLLEGEVVQFEAIHEVFTAFKYTFHAWLLPRCYQIEVEPVQEASRHLSSVRGGQSELKMALHEH